MGERRAPRFVGGRLLAGTKLHLNGGFCLSFFFWCDGVPRKELRKAAAGNATETGFFVGFFGLSLVRIQPGRSSLTPV